MSEFEDHADQHEQPVRDDARKEAADRVAKDRLAGETVAFQRVHHGDVGGQIAAPAHADRREHRDVVEVDRKRALDTSLPAFRMVFCHVL